MAYENSVYEYNENGELCVRVTGVSGGGGDQHNLGWYATQSALETAHPTATDGDWAIVGSTDTVWVWDSDTNVWKDTDQKGQVTSVNGQTGAVELTASDVGAMPSTQYEYTAELEFDPNDSLDVGRIIIKGQQNKCSTAYVRMSIAEYYDNANDWGEAYKDTDYLCVLQPTTQSSTKGCSRVVALDARQTIWLVCGSGEENGLPFVTFDLFYSQSDWSESKVKFIFEISCNDPLDITSTKDLVVDVEELNVNVMCVPTPDYDPNSTDEMYLVNGGGFFEWRPIPQSEGLPTQTGNAGKFLTTDGTDASWSDKPLVNTATGTGAIAVSGTGQGNYSVCIGNSTAALGFGTVAIGNGADARGYGGIAIGQACHAYAPNSIALLQGQIPSSATNAMMFGMGTNNDANTVKFGNANGNFEMMNANGNLPADRLASTTGLADGNYRLRLTMTNGVPSLSWVAE